LAPADIVLEIKARQISHQASLGQALNNYRQRGYRLALSGFSSMPDLDGLLVLQPNILKLRPEEGREGLDLANSAGIATQLSGIESGQDFVLACSAGMDFGQGSLFGLPQADCHPTHSRRRVAYNSHSSSRAPP